jgi:PAS domain S-box-containing protein
LEPRKNKLGNLEGQKDLTRQFRIALAGGFILLTVFVFLVTAYYVGSYQDQYYQRTQNALLAITSIKANQLKTWKEDRIKDGLLMSNNFRLVQNSFRYYQAQNNNELKNRITRELEVYLKFHSYDFFLLGASGTPVLSWPANIAPLETEIFRPLLEEAESGEVMFVDFYKNTSENQYRMALIVPIHHETLPQSLFLIARINPSMELYSTFKNFPQQQMDVEKFFVFRKNGHIFTFTGGRSPEDDSLLVRLSYAGKENVFSALMHDNTRLQKGTGLQGDKVIAAMSEIPGTGWMVVAEIKEQTIMHSFRERVITISIFEGLFLMCIFGLMVLFARQQKLRLLKMSHENELLLDDLINNQPSGVYRLEVTIDNNSIRHRANDPVLPIRYAFISRQHELITGVKESELFNNPGKFIEISHPDDRQRFIEHNIESIDKVRRFTYEGRFIINDNIRWLKFDSLPRLSPPDKIIWTGVVTDVTQQRQLEQEMEQRKSFEKLIASLSSSFVTISLDTRDHIIHAALEQIASFCGTDRAYIFMLDEQTSLFNNAFSWCNEDVKINQDQLQFVDADDVQQWVKTLRASESVNVYNVNDLTNLWKEEKKILQSQHIKSVLAVPIITDDILYGFVGFDSVKEYRKWQHYEIQLLKVFADLIFNALQKCNSEQKLVESQQILRTILDTIRVRVFWKDTNLVYRGCNMAFARDAGLEKPEDIVGLTDEDMIWKEHAYMYRADDRKTLNTLTPRLNYDEKLAIPGNTRWINTTKIPLLNGSGEVVGILGSYQDITEQKLAEDALVESERKYRTLSENAFDGIYLLRDNSLEYVNHRFCEITGYSCNDVTSDGFNFHQLFTSESLDDVYKRKQALKDGKQISDTFESRLLTRQGVARDVEISTSILSIIGEEKLILGIMRDISERKNNETLRNEVIVANKSAVFKQNFLANMSHEIRTPLTGVLGMIDILAHTHLDMAQMDYINTLRISTENLKQIINQILDYSKIEAGEVNLNRLAFKTATLFNNARKLFQSACTKDVDLFINIDPQIPEYIEADEQRLSQVLNNLLSNAIKFTQQGRIDINAGVEKWMGENDLKIKIEVVDTGMGISPDAIKRLFKPFSQVENLDRRPFDGTGLGLSICKELVDLMKGKIGVNSKINKGSTFWFTFCATRVILPESLPEDKNAEVVNGRSLKFLYAEDKLINQKVVKLMLTSLGHEVSIANNGQEVLDMFAPNEYDFILMDIQMPVMDGITATQKLRELYHNLPPIVGLSANAFEGDREKYMTQGLDEYLTKPINTSDLKKVIEKLVVI